MKDEQLKLEEIEVSHTLGGHISNQGEALFFSPSLEALKMALGFGVA